jgi:FKBP-type peptidyl-prolyl cis-trans isomerase
MNFVKRFRAVLPLIVLSALAPGCGTDPSDETVTTEDVVVGTGPTVVTGDFVTVAYVGTLASDGKEFDSGTNFTTRIGVGAVIKGWDQGVPGMRVGGTRRLTIPPSLGYGKNGATGIPGDSVLKFEITLKAIAGK